MCDGRAEFSRPGSLGFAWQGVEAIRPTPAGDSGSSGPESGLLGILLEQVDQCQARAQPQRREQIGRFRRALQTRWVRRKISQLFGAPR